MERQRGLIFKVISGVNEGKYGLAITNRQLPQLSAIEKVTIELYEDADLTKPVIKDNKTAKTITSVVRLERVGFSD